MPATDGTWRFSPRIAANQLIANAVVGSVMLVLALGAFLAVRRATGAMASPLPTPPLMATVAVLIAWAFGVRLAAGRMGRPNLLFTRWLPAFVFLLFAVGCSYPGNRSIDWIAWGTAATIFGLLWIPRRAPMRRLPTREGEEASDEELLQQLVRYRAQNGREAIRGLLVAEFAAGERTATLFVAFCPPFETLPDVELNVADDSSASVKLAQFLHNGVQLEVRLPAAAAQPVRVTIELFAAEAESSSTPPPALAERSRA